MKQFRNFASIEKIDALQKKQNSQLMCNPKNQQQQH